MVNVAGRSKGCTPCRKRRVKCDERRPVCFRCEKAHLTCDGPRGLVIIQDRSVDLRRSEQAIHTGLRHSVNHGLHKHVIVVPKSLSPKVNDLEVSVCFARSFIKPGGAIDIALRHLQPSDIVLAEANAAASPLFIGAFISLAALSYGCRHRERSIISKGRIMHSVTLQKLNRALAERSSCADDAVILSVAILAVLETIVPSHAGSYRKHIMGLERLLELRDPSAQCSPLASTLYENIKIPIILASVREQRSTVFARADWKAKLRAGCSDEEGWEQDLLDILADCSSLLARRQQYAVGDTPDLKELSKVEEEAMVLLERLRKWRARWDEEEQYSHLADCSSLASLQLALKASGDDWSPYLPVRPLTFVSDNAAALLLQYNATVLSVLRLSASLQSVNKRMQNRMSALQHNGPRHPSGPLRPFQDRLTIMEVPAILEICCCIPYCIRRGVRLSNRWSPSAQWAVTMAWMMLGRSESAVGGWITDAVGMRDQDKVAQGFWRD